MQTELFKKDACFNNLTIESHQRLKKTVFAAFLLGTIYERNSVEENPASSFLRQFSHFTAKYHSWIIRKTKSSKVGLLSMYIRRGIGNVCCI